MNILDPITLHFIQDVPTPHNNALLKALRANPSVDLRIWYSYLTHPQYSFAADLGYAEGAPTVYGAIWPNWHLLTTVLRNREDKVFIVGWTNASTRVLVPLLWMLRRPYNMWFDHPADRPSAPLRRTLRRLYYWLLRTSNAKVFVVGKNTVQYFLQKGFSEKRLVNLPVVVDVDESVADYRERRVDIRNRYNISDEELFIVTGSRLIREKGFDLLIRAMAGLDAEIRKRVKLLLVGKGPERQALIQQTVASDLTGTVFLEEWMSPHDFLLHLGAADIAVHPARFDAYGGITLSAMAAGLPVIASNRAGSAADRVEHGVNGWLYDGEEVSELGKWLSVAFRNRGMLARMGLAARKTAESHSPRVGAVTILDHCI
jgi:glycosyltransferase involved in cell wall biosynthesis